MADSRFARFAIMSIRNGDITPRSWIIPDIGASGSLITGSMITATITVESVAPVTLFFFFGFLPRRSQFVEWAPATLAALPGHPALCTLHCISARLGNDFSNFSFKG